VGWEFRRADGLPRVLKDCGLIGVNYWPQVMPSA
jgi:hypothetical protein